MLRQYPLEVVTTVAYHPAGRDLHLRNLEWALQDVPHRTTVFAFDHHRFRSLFGERYLEVGPVGREEFDFHGHFLPGVLDGDAEMYLFMQQDILFHRRLRRGHQMQETGSSPTPCFAVLDLGGNRLYPRIWEGGYLLPGAFLRRARRDGVDLGSQYHWASRHCSYPFFRRSAFRDHVGRAVIPVASWLRSTPRYNLRCDKLVDLTLYAAYHEEPQGRPLGITSHLSGPEYAHRCLPRCYEDPGLLLVASPGTFDRPLDVPTTGLMFLLAGVIGPGEVAGTLLKSPRAGPGGVPGAGLVRKWGRDWMTADQWRSLEWACECLDGLTASRRLP